MITLVILAAMAAVLFGAYRHRPSPTSPFRLLVIAYILSVPIEDFLRVRPVGPVNGLTDWLGLAMIGACGYRWLTRPDLRAAAHAAVPLWIGLPGLAALGYGWSVESDATYLGVITLFAIMAIPVALSFVVVGADDLDRLLGWVAASAAIPGGLAIILSTTGRLAGQGSESGRFSSVGGDFNHTAAALLVPLAAALVLAARRRPVFSLGNWPAMAAALAWAGIALTASRGAVVGALMVMAVIVFAMVKGSQRVPLAVAGVAVLLLLAVPAFSRSGSGTTGRSSIYRIGVEACPDHCWIGSGLSTFPAVHERLAVESPELGRTFVRFQAHNLWLGMAVEQGLVVMVLWTASIVSALAMARRADHLLGPAMLAAGVGLLTTNLFLDGWEFKYFWLPLALGVLAANSTRPEARSLPALHKVGARS